MASPGNVGAKSSRQSAICQADRLRKEIPGRGHGGHDGGVRTLFSEPELPGGGVMARVRGARLQAAFALRAAPCAGVFFSLRLCVSRRLPRGACAVGWVLISAEAHGTYTPRTEHFGHSTQLPDYVPSPPRKLHKAPRRQEATWCALLSAPVSWLRGGPPWSCPDLRSPRVALTVSLSMRLTSPASQFPPVVQSFLSLADLGPPHGPLCHVLLCVRMRSVFRDLPCIFQDLSHEVFLHDFLGFSDGAVSLHQRFPSLRPYQLAPRTSLLKQLWPTFVLNRSLPAFPAFGFKDVVYDGFLC